MTYRLSAEEFHAASLVMEISLNLGSTDVRRANIALNDSAKNSIGIGAPLAFLPNFYFKVSSNEDGTLVYRRGERHDYICGRFGGISVIPSTEDIDLSDLETRYTGIGHMVCYVTAKDLDDCTEVNVFPVRYSNKPIDIRAVLLDDPEASTIFRKIEFVLSDDYPDLFSLASLFKRVPGRHRNTVLRYLNTVSSPYKIASSISYNTLPTKPYPEINHYQDIIGRPLTPDSTFFIDNDTQTLGIQRPYDDTKFSRKFLLTHMAGYEQAIKPHGGV